MIDSREEICKAIADPMGTGARMERLASYVLRLSDSCFHGDPRRFAVRRGYQVRAMLRSDERATVVRGERVRCISFLTDPDPEVWGLNMFIGDALSVAADYAGTMVVTRSEIFQLAGYLAFPATTTRLPHLTHDFLPAWFSLAHERRHLALDAMPRPSLLIPIGRRL